MKKIILGLFGTVIILMVLSTLIYLEISKKNNSYSTPEEALLNYENELIEVWEIVDTKFFDEVAYVFYYTELNSPKDYLAAGKIKKNKYGWRVERTIGVGTIEKDNAKMASGRDEHIVGFASKEVDKVKLGMHEAEIIELENEYINAFLFHGVDLKTWRELEIEFLDKEGNELP